MTLKDEIKETLDYHIKKLEERVRAIYTISPPNGYHQTTEKINLLDEIEKYEVLESVYSVLDNDDIKTSKTAHEYSGYLENVRKSLDMLQSELAMVDKENHKEIDNIILLLNRFKEEREKFK